MIKTCRSIAETDNDLQYIVIAGNDSVCSSSHSDNVPALSEMFAMVFEDDPVLLKAAINGLAILEGTETNKQLV